MKKIKRRETNPVLVAGFSIACGIITGILWAYASPLQLVPGIIQWRTFAFLPPAIGILISPTAGFVSGYLGAVIWSILAHIFMVFPAHILLIDGVMAGLTGFIPAVTTGKKFTLTQMTAPRALGHGLMTAIGATMLMVVVNSASFAVMKLYSFSWALGWFGLSLLVPVALGVPLTLRYCPRILQHIKWVPTERL
jgi:hypothetical protein